MLSTAEADRISEAAHFIPESLDMIPAGSAVRVRSSGKSSVSAMKKASEGTATHGSTTTTCLSFLMKKGSYGQCCSKQTHQYDSGSLMHYLSDAISSQKYKILICPGKRV